MSLSDSTRHLIIDQLQTIHSGQFGEEFGAGSVIPSWRDAETYEDKVFNIVAFLVKDTLFRVEPGLGGDVCNISSSSSAVDLGFKNAYRDYLRYVTEPIPDYVPLDDAVSDGFGRRAYEYKCAKVEEMRSLLNYPVKVYSQWLLNGNLRRDSISKEIAKIQRKALCLDGLGSRQTLVPQETRRLDLTLSLSRVLSGQKAKDLQDNPVNLRQNFPHFVVDNDANVGWLYVKPGSNSQFADIWLEIFRFGEFLLTDVVNDDDNEASFLVRHVGVLRTLLNEAPASSKYQAYRRQLSKAIAELERRQG